MLKASIIMASGHALLRQALTRFIQEDPTLSVVSEAGDGLELLRLLEKTTPDVVILDISLPKLSGLETSAIIKQRYPEVKVVLLSEHHEKEYFYKALENGVDGYVIKTNIEKVNGVIKSMLKDKTYVVPLSLG